MLRRLADARSRFALFVALAAASAAPSFAQNEIAIENALPGNPSSEWDVTGAGDPSIQGFTTDISVNQGETVFFKIGTPAADYRIDVYRMGWYGGLGARKVATVQPSASLPQAQPAPLTDPATGLVDCGNWAVSASWAVPADAVSGIYVAKLVREDPEDGRASHVLFVVRDDDGGSDLLLQANDETWHAYNTYGGNSLYNGSPAGRAYKVSYNRPFTTRCCNYPDGAIVTWFFSAPYPMVRWLEANGYDVSYTTGVDTDRRGAELLEHGVFISVGHDEYWSSQQRANVKAARDAGVNLAVFSGNEMFWKTRWEPSLDAGGTPYRTLVCYKETHAGAKIDPLANVWTGTWRDPRFSPPADGGLPENELLGTIFKVNGVTNNELVVPEADGKMRLWRNTSVATLLPGQSATFATGTLGFEWDEDADNGFRPPGLFHVTSTTVSGVPVLQDYGSTFGSGTATHHATMYRAPSGALVFSAGTVQWSWGLDATHDNPGTPSDSRLQQATLNLFADMGVQPTTIQPGLVPASASADAIPPSSAIVSPLAGADVTAGTLVTITGAASDAGGRVGGIEVSVDGGATWHPAQGRELWSYAWTPSSAGSATIRSRSVDDSGNLESPGAGVTVTVHPPVGGVCPCHLFEGAGGPAASDAQSVELGVRFRSDRSGFVTGLRFYKPGPSNGGTHVGHLWTNAGANLRAATFANETASGWQQVDFGAGNEVPVTAETLYVASVLMPQGNYAATQAYFATHGEDRAPLHAPRDGAGGFPNGVYAYGAGGFPTGTFASSNYWVDVVFDTALAGSDTTAPAISNVLATPGPDGNSATVSWTTDEPATSRVDYGTSAGALSASASNGAFATSHALALAGLAPGTTYHYRVTSADGSANAATSPAPPAAPLTFATASPPCVADATSAEFARGRFGAGAYAGATADGEVMLAPAAGSEFGGAGLPAGWTGTPWAAGGAAAVSGGALAVDGARAGTDAAFASPRTLEFSATFGGDPFQHVGFANDFDFNSPWAVFSTFSGGGLYARASNGTNTAIPGSWFGAPHRYRIAWTGGTFDFAVDGAPVASIPFAVGGALRALASDFGVGGGAIALDWLRLSPYAASGTYTSRVVDAGAAVAWNAISWSADAPAGTSVALAVRVGNAPVPDGSWTAFTPVAASGSVVGVSSRYLQYRATLATSDGTLSPVLRDVTVACAPSGVGAPDPARARASAPVVTPNPLVSGATLRYAIGVGAGAVPVELAILDLHGRVVRVLERGPLGAGEHVARWDARDARGAPVVPGVYYYRFRAGETSARGKLVVLR